MCGLSVSAALAGRQPEPQDDLVRQFAECLQVRSRTGPGGQRLTAVRDDLLNALRQLRDPKLKPLFAELAASKRPDFRRHGILGLAELDPEKRLNVLLVAKLETPSEQAAILRAAMVSDLVKPDQITEILAWPGLEPYVELVLRLRLLSTGQATDAARFRELAKAESAPTAVMARLCLAQTGDTEAALDAFTRLNELEPEPRAALMALTLEVIRNEKMDKAAPYITSFSAEAEPSFAFRAEVIRTLQVIAPDIGAAEWLKAYSSAQGLADRLKFALLAMDAAEQATPAMCDALEAGEGSGLLKLIGAAVRAVATKKPDPAPEFIALAAQNYRAATAWVLDRVAKLSDDQRVGVASAIIVQTEEARSRGESVPDTVVGAAAAIAEVRPAALTPLLRRACERNDAVMSQALFAGMLRTGTAPAWAAGERFAWSDPSVEALAELYDSRTRPDALSDAARRERLRKIGTGRGDLPDVFKVQAAWLALVAEGREREALARVLAAGGEE